MSISDTSNSQPGFPIIMLAAISLLIPCVVSLLLFNHWFPFFLNGPQFLRFYGLHMLTGIVLLRCYPFMSRHSFSTMQSTSGLRAALIITGLLLSAARIGQGWYHGRPVSYLVLLTIAYLPVLLLTARKQVAVDHNPDLKG